MPDPFETLRWFVVGLYEIYKDPSMLAELARPFAIGLAVQAPVLISLWSLRKYAKRHGREFPDGVVALSNSREPFADPRLNEPFDLIRRSRPVVTGVLLIGGLAAAITFSSMAIFFAACVAMTFAIVSKRLYVEACLAFGAKASTQPELGVAAQLDTA